MSRLIVAGICALLALPALAEDEGSLADAVKPPAAGQSAAPADQNATEAPADVDMANVRAAQQAASGVPATGEGQGGVPPPAAPAGGEQAGGQQAEPKSSIPLDKRQGGDITQCLEAGDKSDKAIAACANKYRPRARSR